MLDWHLPAVAAQILECELHNSLRNCLSRVYSSFSNRFVCQLTYRCNRQNTSLVYIFPQSIYRHHPVSRISHTSVITSNLIFVAHQLQFTTTLAILIWARYKYFGAVSNTELLASRIYDPVATIHLVLAIWYLLASAEPNLAALPYAIFLNTAGISLFLWCIITVRYLNFATAGSNDLVITNGPFNIVRHPLYASYLLIWTSNTLLFNSITLWITLTFMLAFYLFSAKREEELLINGKCSREYGIYKSKVGMFFPRVTQWKSWILEP